jgi:hypothetical protein
MQEQALPMQDQVLQMPEEQALQMAQDDGTIV